MKISHVVGVVLVMTMTMVALKTPVFADGTERGCDD